MALERLARRSRGRVPEHDSLVGCGRHQLAVRRECHGPDHIRMALERLAHRSRGKVPEPDRLRLSSDADATSLPSGENATAPPQPDWPLSVLRAVSVAESPRLTVLSSDADATSLPSGGSPFLYRRCLR